MYSKKALLVVVLLLGFFGISPGFSQSDSSLLYRRVHLTKQHQLGVEGNFMGARRDQDWLFYTWSAQLSYGYFLSRNWVVGGRASYWRQDGNSPNFIKGRFWRAGLFSRYYLNLIEKRLHVFPELAYETGTFYYPDGPNPQFLTGLKHHLKYGLGLSYLISRDFEVDMVVQRLRAIGCAACGPTLESYLGLKYYFPRKTLSPQVQTIWDRQLKSSSISQKGSYYLGTAFHGIYTSPKSARDQNASFLGMVTLKGGWFIRRGWSVGLAGRLFYRHYDLPVTRDREGLFWQAMPYVRRHVQVSDYPFLVLLEAGYGVGSYYFTAFNDAPVLDQGITHMTQLGLGAELRPSQQWGYGFMLRSRRVLNCAECFGAPSDWQAALANSLTWRWEVNRYF